MYPLYLRFLKENILTQFSFEYLSVIVETKNGNHLTPCSTYNKTKLWFLPSPFGHLYKGKWKVENCLAPSSNKLAICLRRKHFVIYGDSTSRQTLHRLIQRFNCSSIVRSVNPTNNTSNINDMLVCEQSNITIDWIRHALPGNTGRDSSAAVATDLFRYKKRRNVVFLIQIFGHFSLFHPRAFRERMRLIRKSIEIFLKSNQDVLFMLRGGHFYHTGRAKRYANYIFRLILIEEFSGLLDKVIYIDYVDITIATRQKEIHAEGFVVDGLVDQYLSYICS